MMTDTFTPMEELENFLGATFHQDASPYQEALQEYIERADKDFLKLIVDAATEFLNSDTSDEEKNEFIESNAEINFSYYGLTPIEWLSSVVETLEKEIENK